MDKDFCNFIKDNGFNILITDKYVEKHCYDLFDKLFIVSNTKSVLAASISFNLFEKRTVCYIDNFFELLYVYDDCYKHNELSALLIMDRSKLPKNIDIGLLNTFGITYVSDSNYTKNNLFRESLKDVKEGRGSCFLVLGGK
jgi:hypothetical protein